MVTTFLWPEWLGPGVPISAWTFVVGMVAVSTWKSRQQTSESPDDASDSQEDLFIQAQLEYLKAHWFEAESLLQQVLQNNPQDTESRLMLAGLYRHTRRGDDAKKQLGLLQSSAGVDKWESEIHRERELLDQFDDPSENQPDHNSDWDSSVSHAA